MKTTTIAAALSAAIITGNAHSAGDGRETVSVACGTPLISVEWFEAFLAETKKTTAAPNKRPEPKR